MRRPVATQYEKLKVFSTFPGSTSRGAPRGGGSAVAVRCGRGPNQAENEWPQPQVPVAFGFLTENPEPIRDS